MAGRGPSPSLDAFSVLSTLIESRDPGLILYDEGSIAGDGNANSSLSALRYAFFVHAGVFGVDCPTWTLEMLWLRMPLAIIASGDACNAGSGLSKPLKDGVKLLFLLAFAASSTLCRFRSFFIFFFPFLYSKYCPLHSGTISLSRDCPNFIL